MRRWESDFFGGTGRSSTSNPKKQPNKQAVANTVSTDRNMVKLLDFVAGLDEQEHQAHGRETEKQHKRKPSCHVHCGILGSVIA